MAAAPYTPPYSYDFNSGLGEFTSLDSNGDGNTFKLTSYSGYNYSGGAFYDGTATQGSANDWLFTPELTLQSGLVYEMSFYCKTATDGKTNKLEIKAGSTKTAEGMTVNVLDVTDIPGNSWEYKTVRFSVEATGSYYVGFHALSESGQNYFYIDNISIAAGVNPLAPNAPAAQTPTFSVNGSALEAQISITAPTTTFSGDALSGNVTLNIKRADSETPATLTAAPGATVTYTDTHALLTSTTYDITCTANGVESQATTVTANPVFGTPNPVEDFTVTQNDNIFTLSWNAVTTPTIEGEIFIPSSVRYNIKCGNNTVVTDFDGTTTTYTYPMPEEGQEIIKFSIEAKFGDKVSATASSGTYVVGNALAGDFAESFANYSYTNGGWSTDPEMASYGWRPSSGISYPTEISAQDGDNGMIQFSLRPGNEQRLVSPKLDLTNLQNGKLKFWMFMLSSGSTKVQPGFIVNGVETLLGEPLMISDGESNGWKEFTYILPESATTSPSQLVFVGTGNATYENLFIDNITIRSYLAHNLAVNSEAPVEGLEIGQQINITADIVNKGSNPESDYNVNLYANDELVATVAGTEVPVDGTLSVSIPFTALPKYATLDVEFRIEVSSDADLDTSDNEVAFTIPVAGNELAVPTDLTATSSVENVQLAWAAPVYSTDPVISELSESFENWETGVTEPINGWVFIDADDNYEEGLNGVNNGKKFAAMVSEGYTGPYSWSYAFNPYDGEKALVMTTSDSWGLTSNNWIISPEVQSGSNFSFYSIVLYEYTASLSFDVLWSAGGTDPSDFTVIETKTVGKDEWTECSYTLPDDARRFAIHYTGNMGNYYGLGFDKFTFTSFSPAPVLSGYNLYRDDAFVATLPADVTSYADAEALPDVTHSYNVTALYDKGESLYSEAATGSRGTSVGIQGIDSDLEDAQYYTLDGLRIDNPAKGQIVIVRRGNNVSKMIVK